MKGVDKMSFIMVKHITKTFKVSEKRNTNKMQIMVDCEILLYVVLITDDASVLTC
mgnify:CR=1 FL=1